MDLYALQLRENLQSKNDPCATEKSTLQYRSAAALGHFDVIILTGWFQCRNVLYSDYGFFKRCNSC
jgi:hypothetical protein